MFIFLVILISYLLVAAMVAIGVVGGNPGALTPMLRAPRHFVRLLFSRQMRRNHALEHATINVIESRYGRGRTGLVGMPAEDGFHLRGRVSPDIVATATQEAIRRLRRGETHLARQRRCPTSLVATQLLLTVIFVAIVLGVQQGYSAPGILIALLAAALLGSPLSPYLQRIVLIDASVGDMAMRDVEFEEPKSRLGLLSFVVLSPIFVRTAVVGASSRSDRSGGGEVTLITGDQEEIPAGRYRLRE